MIRRLDEPGPVTLQLMPVLELSDDELFELCQLNRDLRIERSSQGELILMSPTGGSTSHRNAEIIYQLQRWARQQGTGRTFDSSGGFRLPSGAIRSPDAAWVASERLQGLSSRERDRFLPLCPDFVVELRSPSDPLATVQEKLREYIEHGCRLGWLIDPAERTVHVYRPGHGVETLVAIEEIFADPELPGFVLRLADVWEPWS